MSKLTIKHIIPLKSRAKVGSTGRRFKWMTPLVYYYALTTPPPRVQPPFWKAGTTVGEWPSQWQEGFEIGSARRPILMR